MFTCFSFTCETNRPTIRQLFLPSLHYLVGLFVLLFLVLSDHFLLSHRSSCYVSSVCLATTAPTTTTAHHLVRLPLHPSLPLFSRLDSFSLFNHFPVQSNHLFFTLNCTLLSDKRCRSSRTSAAFFFVVLFWAQINHFFDFLSFLKSNFKCNPQFLLNPLLKKKAPVKDERKLLFEMFIVHFDIYLKTNFCETNTLRWVEFTCCTPHKSFHNSSDNDKLSLQTLQNRRFAHQTLFAILTRFSVFCFWLPHHDGVSWSRAKPGAALLSPYDLNVWCFGKTNLFVGFELYFLHLHQTQSRVANCAKSLPKLVSKHCYSFRFSDRKAIRIFSFNRPTANRSTVAFRRSTLIRFMPRSDWSIGWRSVRCYNDFTMWFASTWTTNNWAANVLCLVIEWAR